MTAVTMMTDITHTTTLQRVIPQRVGRETIPRRQLFFTGASCRAPRVAFLLNL